MHAFEGNRAETTTMIPVLTGFLNEHALRDVTVVADAGMVAERPAGVAEHHRQAEPAGRGLLAGTDGTWDVAAVWAAVERVGPRERVLAVRPAPYGAVCPVT